MSFFYSSEDSGSADWPWCAVFSSREMALLEQNEDLHYYYQDGYHYNISRQMTGVLLGDLLGMAGTSTTVFVKVGSRQRAKKIMRLGLFVQAFHL